MSDPYTQPDPTVEPDAIQPEPEPDPSAPYTVELDAFPPAPTGGSPHGVVIEASEDHRLRLTSDADLTIANIHGENPGPLHQGKETTIAQPVRLTVPNGHAASVYVEPMAA